MCRVALGKSHTFSEPVSPFVKWDSKFAPAPLLQEQL